MATFQYIKGGQVQNAVGYRLYLRDELEDAQNERLIMNRDVQLPLDIRGFVGKDGLPVETENVIYSGGGSSGAAVPIMKMGDTDYEFYYRIKGKINVVVSGTSGAVLPSPDKLSKVPFEFIYKIERKSGERLTQKTHWFKLPTQNYFELKLEDGIQNFYLTVEFSENVNAENPTWESVRIKVYSANTSNVGIVKASLAGYTNDSSAPSVAICAADSRCMRSDYIPMDCLTDDLNIVDGGNVQSYCVGYLNDKSVTDGTLYYKISFYDENLEFVGGITPDKVAGKQYLTVADIENFAKGIVNKESDYDPIKWVVFCSNNVNTVPNYNSDIVSVGAVYIPLLDSRVNAGDTLYIADDSHLFVQSVGDGVFFKDSKEKAYAGRFVRP